MVCAQVGERAREPFPMHQSQVRFSFQVGYRNSAIIQWFQFFGTCCQGTGRPARASLGRGIGFQPKAVKCKPRSPTGSLGAFPLQTTEAECRYRAGPCWQHNWYGCSRRGTTVGPEPKDFVNRICEWKRIFLEPLQIIKFKIADARLRA